MSSPVAKIRHFSRFFSVTSPTCSKSKLPSSSSLKGSPILSTFPGFHSDTDACSVATPATKSPTLCSTPLLELIHLQPFQTSAENELCSNSVFTSIKSVHLSSTERRVTRSIANLSPYKYLSASTSRQRRSGVSDTALFTFRSKESNLNEPLNSENKRHRSSNSAKRRCCVFSSSMTPGISPSLNSTSRLMRLSGIVLSPTSVSWVSRSPVTLETSNFGRGSPSYFRWYSGKRKVSHGSGQKRLQDSIEECPPGKFYFWEENENELITLEQLGRGGFGKVFKGIYRGEKVAIKKLESLSRSRQVLLETFQGELTGLRLRHPNIVRTLVVMQPSLCSQYETSKYPCYVVMEYAGNKNLSQLITDPNRDISIAQRYRYSSDILLGLAYLHAKRLAHLDLKPSNVVVTLRDVCKLCDFGSCVSLTSPQAQDNEERNNNQSGSTKAHTTNSSVTTVPMSSRSSTESSKSSSHLTGTFVYRAPELLRGLQPTTKADIFSFSVTAWQLWSRVPPYSGHHHHTVVFAVVAFGTRPSIPQLSSNSAECSEEEKADKMFFDLLPSCWNSDPMQRPSAAQAQSVIQTCLQFLN